MKLQTNIKLQPQRFNQIDYNAKVLLLGSCFSENIGVKFSYFKFQKLQNPFGILFHPLAVENLITDVINEKEYTSEDIFLHNEQFHSFAAHSSLSTISENDILKSLNDNLKATHTFLKDASHIIITLGTAWAYRHIESDTYVANCHKVPQKQFLKELLSVEQIVESLEAIVTLVKDINPNVNFIFTVSPVRHIKDGFVENTQSKSHLITAIHQVVDPRHHRFYFPSYEIMMDELRDYRFYDDDMLHPNDLAINYIWNYFQNVWISEDCKTLMSDVDDIQKGLAHRPFNEKSEAHQQFLQKLKTKQSLLKSKFSHIEF